MVFAKVTEECVRKGDRVLILATQRGAARPVQQIS
ncbi:MAG: hypothetical protein ACLUTU_00530 [Blautia faecis]